MLTNGYNKFWNIVSVPSDRSKYYEIKKTYITKITEIKLIEILLLNVDHNLNNSLIWVFEFLELHNYSDCHIS